MDKLEYKPVEERLDTWRRLIRAAGYAPSISISSAELSVSLCKEYGVEVPEHFRARLRKRDGNPDHMYVPCWNIMVVASGGYPVVPGGLYCTTVQKGAIKVDRLVRKFCYHYWKGEGKRPTKKAMGL
jgi:hypothetical protein